MQMPLHQFLVPYLRRRRFWEAIRVNNHKVFPLWPGSCHELPALNRGIFDQDVDDESISYLEEREAEIAFPTGAINQTTVVEVTSALSQELMDEVVQEQGAQIWTPQARYYLFDYVEPSALPASARISRGLRILNDGEWIPYPGNLMDGHLVHWEHDPWAVGTHPLPGELRDSSAPILS
jgi:hypothetical protein